MKSFLFIPLVNIVSFSILLSCESKPTIPEENFIRIYADMTIMQDTSTLPQGEIREKVLSNYHYSEKDYNQTIEAYNSNPEKWAKFFDKVIVYVENLKTKAKKIEPLVLPRRYVLKDM